MINVILTPMRRMALALSFLLFGAGIAQADDGACRWWCGSGVCCQMDDSGLCGERVCLHNCGDLTGWKNNREVLQGCGDPM